METRLIRPSDRIFVAGARGMAGSAIVRASRPADMAIQLMAGRYFNQADKQLNLLDDVAVRHWINEQKPDVVVLAAATVGGIEANRVLQISFSRTYESRPRLSKLHGVPAQGDCYS